MNAKRMKQPLSLVDLTIVLLIIGLGVVSRFALEDYPNFKPVASLALFAGFYFRRWLIAGVAIVSMMLISDLMISTYDWAIMAAVYLSMLFAGAMGIWVGRATSSSRNWVSGLACVASSFSMALVFFVLTNFATWACWYEASFAGLLECYVNALPFFRATLVGDLVFTSGWVMAYQVLVVLAARRKQSIAVNS